MPKFIDPVLFEELKKGRHLPSPAGVRQTIMHLCMQENTNIAEITRLVQADPVLSGIVIQISNLANAGRTRAIAGVGTDTLIRIGLHSIRQLALALSLTNGNVATDCVHFDYATFWPGSFIMAAAAQAIAAESHIAPLAEMFTTGLLARVGKLGLASARSDSYSALLARALPAASQLAMEQALFGFSHLSLAAAMMNEWKIPLLFCDAVLYHETPELSGFEPESRRQELVLSLQLASRIAEIGIAPECDATSELNELSAMADAIGLSQDQLRTICENTEKDWDSWEKIMNFPRPRILQNLQF